MWLGAGVQGRAVPSIADVTFADFYIICVGQFMLRMFFFMIQLCIDRERGLIERFIFSCV